jgi:acetoacetyl-CoA synthetase
MNKPNWEPRQERIERANLGRFMRYVREQTGNEDIRRYAPLYDFSIHHPARFWALLWEFCGIRASGDFEPVLVDADRMPGAQWFPGVRLNFAQNLLRHKDDRPAIVFRNERGHRRQHTYAELHSEVARVAHALKRAGVGIGDRVAGLMPNIPEAVIAMLATTSIGAIWSSCSPDSRADQIVGRLGQIGPKVLFTVDRYDTDGERFDCIAEAGMALEKIADITALVVVHYGGDPLPLDGIDHTISWGDFAGHEDHPLQFEMLPFAHPLYITYSSNAGGTPECIVHGAGGTLIQHLKELVLHVDLKREDRFLCHAPCDSMMWSWLASGLAIGSTMVLYDGASLHTDGSALWDIADELGISIFGSSAKWLSSTESAGIKPIETHKLLNLKTILVSGSPLMPESYDYVYRDIKDRVLFASIPDSPDLLSSFTPSNPLLPVWQGELQCRGLGMKVEIIDESGKPVREQRGVLGCSAPFPSMPIFFWNDTDGERYRNAYFARVPGIWSRGDEAMLTVRDSIVLFDRSDAALGPDGKPIDAAEIHRLIEQIPEVLESALVGQRTRDDQRVILFVILREGIVLDEELRRRIAAPFRNSTMPSHVRLKIVQVPDIPRTLSGKISEIALHDAINDKPVRNIDALANPQVLAFYATIAELQN